MLQWNKQSRLQRWECPTWDSRLYWIEMESDSTEETLSQSLIPYEGGSEARNQTIDRAMNRQKRAWKALWQHQALRVWIHVPRDGWWKFHRVNGQKGGRASAKEVTRPEHPGLCRHIKDLWLIPRWSGSHMEESKRISKTTWLFKIVNALKLLYREYEQTHMDIRSY